MRTTTWLVALWLAFASLAATAGETLRVRVTDFAPLYFQQNGQWVGLDVELAQAVAHEAGLTLDYVPLPWSRALLQLRTGEIDLMLNLSRSEDREAYTRFVGPVRLSRRALVVRRENLGLPITNLDELADVARRTGLPFGIQRDAKYADDFDARLATDPAFAAEFDAVSNGSQLPRKVAQRHNLGFFEDMNYAIYHLRFDPEFRDLAIHSFLLRPAPVYFGLSRRLDPAIADRVEAAVERLEANGTLAQIRAKWDDAGGR